MKLKLSVLLATVTLALTAQAELGRAIKLPDGTTGKVISENGVTTGYVKSVKVSAEGKTVIEQGQVFDGERIVKSSEGKCFKTQDKLLELKELSAGDAKIQVPTTKHEAHEVPCTS